MIDTLFIKFFTALIQPILNFFFRVEIHGVENIKDEQYLFISNHNIGVLEEAFIILCFYEKHKKNNKKLYFLAHPFFLNFPVFSIFFKKIGCIPSNYESASNALIHGDSLHIFPGGNLESTRPFSQRHTANFYQRKGWVKLAQKHRVEILPFSIYGSHSINPVLIRSSLLAKILILPKLLSVTVLTLTLSQVIYTTFIFYTSLHFISYLSITLLLTLITFMFSSLFPIWFPKIRLKIHSSIPKDGLNNPNLSNAENINLIYENVLNTIQTGMNELRKK